MNTATNTSTNKGAADSTEAAIDAVNLALRAHTGIALSKERRGDLRASLGRVMADGGANDPAHWTARLKASPELFDRVIADITIGETYFFREPEHFAFVRNDVLPAVRERKPGQEMRVWSAGCATGEEAYSLAILLDEAGAPAQILATDISRPSLAKAKKGIYGRWSLRGDGARIIGSYLRPVPMERTESYQMIERMRNHVRFAYLNLGLDPDPAVVQPGSMDLIFCRNVLIYLDEKTIGLVAQRFYDALADGGVLITGPSDPVLNDRAPFVTEAAPGGLIYRKDIHGRRHQPARLTTPEASEPADDIYVGDIYSESEPAIVEDTITLVATPPIGDAQTAAFMTLRGLADTGNMAKALAFAATATAAHPSSAEIAFLHAVLLMNVGRMADAETILKRLVYLNPALAVAHFALGNLRARTGDSSGALRAFRAAQQAAASRPALEIPALSEGDSAGQIAIAAAARAAQLEKDNTESALFSVRRASQ